MIDPGAGQATKPSYSSSAATKKLLLLSSFILTPYIIIRGRLNLIQETLYLIQEILNSNPFSYARPVHSA